MIYERIPFHHLVRISFSIRVLLYLLILLFSLVLYYFQVHNFNINTIVLLISIALGLCLIYYVSPIKKSLIAYKYNIIVLYIDAQMLNFIFYTLNISSPIMDVYGVYMFLVITGSVFFSKFYRIIYCLYIIVCYMVFTMFHQLGAMDLQSLYSLVVGVILILLSGIITYIYIEFIDSFRHLASLGKVSMELAHEVRNPLQIIEAYAERGISDPNILEEIRNQIEKVARFIQELLSLGSENTSNTRRENINHIVDYAISLICSIPGYADHIELEKELSHEDLLVNADIEQITKVFTNIMRNGIESMKKVGKLVITVQKQGTEWARISIQDTGIGIDESDLKKIFQPFYTTKRGTRGAGLGLAIVKKFVKANKGTIEVFSQSGLGATFIIKLPLA